MTTNGLAIRRKRIEDGMTLRDLSAKVGMGIDALSLIERGKRQPRPATLKRIANGLNVAVGALLLEAVE
ncbi:helix-turn-helix domain-containing protein [Streptomyces sp. NPDC059568]|uniref:helix-turn-helix domain-containing protein n=1 Tax=Streptomyces sp. NPDC059568 TaxID=3346868 RepID=UPI0036C94064